MGRKLFCVLVAEQRAFGPLRLGRMPILTYQNVTNLIIF